MSQYRPCLERWGDYTAAALCKAHIFHSAYLLNTEIIITILSKPLIKSAQSVGTVMKDMLHLPLPAHIFQLPHTL